MTDQPDGIRLERALDSNGNSRQEYRLFPTRRDWTWAFDAGQLLNRVEIGKKSYAGSNTSDTAASVPGQSSNALSGQQGTNRMFTSAWVSHAYQQGFSFGTGVGGGSSASNNYLWTSGNEGSPLPFTPGLVAAPHRQRCRRVHPDPQQRFPGPAQGREPQRPVRVRQLGRRRPRSHRRAAGRAVADQRAPAQGRG